MKKLSGQVRYQKAHKAHRGRITLWLGQDLKAEVLKTAKARGNSISGIVRVLLKKWIQKGRS